jgi:hypothetical protein
MGENAGSRHSAVNEGPAEPATDKPPRPKVEVSAGNGVVQQLLDWIERMSSGDKLLPKVLVSVLVFTLVVAILGALTVLGISVVKHSSLSLTTGAAGVSLISAMVARKYLPKKSKQSKEPRN